MASVHSFSSEMSPCSDAAVTPAFSICVYCGSRSGVAEPFVDTARAVGRWIGERGD